MLMRPGPEPPVQLPRLHRLQRFGFRRPLGWQPCWAGHLFYNWEAEACVVTHAFPWLAPLLWDLVVGVTWAT